MSGNTIGPVEVVAKFKTAAPLNDAALAVFRSKQGNIHLCGGTDNVYMFSDRFAALNSTLQDVVTNLFHSVRAIVELSGGQDGEQVLFLGVNVKQVGRVERA